MLVDASKTNVLVSELVGKLRDKNTEPAEFRTNLKRLGNFLAYEAGNYFSKTTVSVETLLGQASYEIISDELVVITILRAALPMSEGVLEIIPKARVGIVSATRGKKLQQDGKDFQIDCTYWNIPPLENKVVLIVDPMLASGSTLLFVMRELMNQKPSKIIVICAIASEFGINRILDKYPKVTIVTGDVDEELNEKGYIVPGLGDAGDRAFNT